MRNYIKLLTNSMLLIILLGVLALPAVSTGIMRVAGDDRVLSSQDVRITTPVKNPIPAKTTKIETYIIEEKPYRPAAVEKAEEEQIEDIPTENENQMPE